MKTALKRCQMGVLTLILLTASAASAATYTFGSSYLGGGAITVWPTASSSEATVAGMYQLTQEGGPTFNIFCIDLLQRVDWGQPGIPFTWAQLANAPVGAVYGSSWTGMGEEKAGIIQGLLNEYYPKINGVAANAENLQLAIWDVLAGRDVLSQADATPSGRIGEMITYATANPGNPYLYDALTVNGTQNFVDPTHVPDGGVTALMLGTGMMSLAWFRRMKK